MKASNLQDVKKKNLFEDRAVMVCAVTVTVFLCLLTIFEVLTLKLEWNVPVVHAMAGGADAGVIEEMGAVEESEDTVCTEDTACAEDTACIEDTACTEDTACIEDIICTEDAEEVTVTEEDPFPYYLKINRQQNVVTVYSKDESGEYTIPVKAILCSTGLYNATPKGTFQLSSKYVWRELNGGVYGQYASRITGGVLFHSVPYARKNKATLSVSKYNKLGQQASMGCVRLTVEDAKWIYDNCPSGTYVEIYDSEDPGPLGKPEAMKLDADSPNKGWDPTDPDERNPWHAWSEDE